MKRSEVRWVSKNFIEFYERLKNMVLQFIEEDMYIQLNDRYINVENSYEGFLLNCESPSKVIITRNKT